METGTVIHGTLNPVDLIRAFAAEVRRLENGLPAGPRPWGWGNEACRVANLEIAAEAETYVETGKLPAGVDCPGQLILDLEEILGGMAPEGFYFGIHPGDGSDFGFWPLPEGEPL